MSERKWGERLDRSKRPLATAGLLAVLIGAGVTIEELRRRYHHKDVLPEGFQLEAYKKQLEIFQDQKHGDLMSVVAATIFAETVLYTSTASPGAPITKGGITKIIAENQLIGFDTESLDVSLQKLLDANLIAQVENPRYVSADDDDFAYIAIGFVSEGKQVRPEIAPVFYETVHWLDPLIPPQ